MPSDDENGTSLTGSEADAAPDQGEPDAVADLDIEMPDMSGVSFDAVLQAAQTQMRDVLAEATSRARREVEATAAALAKREHEVSALEVLLATDRAELAADRKTIDDRAADVAERNRLADLRTKEAEEASERATKALSTAMARTAELVAEAESRISEREATARRQVQELLDEAASRAAQVDADAHQRQAAANEQAETTIREAVSRAERIIGTAEAAAAKSRAELEELVVSVQDFLERAQVGEHIDLAAEMEIDLRETIRAPVEASRGIAPSLADLAGQVDAPTGDDDAEQIASNTVIDSFLAEDETAEQEPAAEDDEDEDQKVSKAVRRAVRGWSSSREQA